MLLDDKKMSDLTIHTHYTLTFQDDPKEVSTSEIKKTQAVKDKVFHCISKTLSAATSSNTCKTQIKMSIYNIAKLSNKDLKNFASEYISLDNVYDECKECGRPIILHQEKECTRYVDEGLEVIVKNWRDLK